jgi:hypothetical protein
MAKFVMLKTKAVAQKILAAYDARSLTLFSKKPRCVYRDCEGKHCAIGIAIPSANYSKDGEGWSIAQAAEIFNVGFEDMEWASTVQQQYDDLLNAKNSGEPTGSYTRRFLKSIRRAANA